jgi:hypothetical protein
MENIIVTVSSIIFGGVIFFVFKLWIFFVRKFDFFFIKLPMIGKYLSYSITIFFLIVFFLLLFFTWFFIEPLYGFCYIIVWVLLIPANFCKIAESDNVNV